MRYQIDTNKIVWRNIDGDTVILNLDSGVYYSLNKTGSLIWSLLNQSKSSDEIAQEVAQEYGVSAKKVTKDVVDIIEDLTQEDLISLAK